MRALRWLALTPLLGCPAGEDSDSDTDLVDTDSDTDVVDTDTDVVDTDTDDTGTEDPRVLVGSSTVGDRTVEFYADQAPQMGLNHVAYRVLDGATPVDDLTVSHLPLMDMGMIVHSCPVTTPMGTGDGYYEADVVFIMSGTWQNTATLGAEAAAVDYAFPDFSVATDGYAKMVMVGDAKWIVSFNLDGDPVVGNNPFVLTVHQRVTDLEFPEIPDLTVDVEPTMPSMGHGSDGNIDPIYSADGKYEGSVNFSMMGEWLVTFTLTDGDGNEVVADFTLDV